MDIKGNQSKTLFFLLIIFIYANPVNSDTQIQVITSESSTLGRISATDGRNYIYFSATGNVNYLSYNTSVKYQETAVDFCKEVRVLLREPPILLNEKLEKKSGFFSEPVSGESIYNGRMWNNAFPTKCLF